MKKIPYSIKTMNFSLLEIILIATQVIIFPLGRYFIINQKEEIIAETKSTISKITNKSFHYIHQNRESITKIEDGIKHRIILLKVRLDVLQARIADLEIDLGKKNGFQCDILTNLSSYEKDCMTDHTEDPYDTNDSGDFDIQKDI